MIYCFYAFASSKPQLLALLLFFPVGTTVDGVRCVQESDNGTTGCSLTDLTPTDASKQCAIREFVNFLPIPNGVVCYNRTTTLEAVYICHDGFYQNGTATRVCQNDGRWSGSIPECLQDPDKEGINSCLGSNCSY